jgi:hypothetical protein
LSANNSGPSALWTQSEHVREVSLAVFCSANSCAGKNTMNIIDLGLTKKTIMFRYKFLAFDFDETVDMTGDNCRLLMVRLKMEGYAMGKSKVYLKYYNEEYLAR